MDVTVKNWSGDAENWKERKYIFSIINKDDKDRLISLLARTSFPNTVKHPKARLRGGKRRNRRSFGYDVVTNSQDGCPLADVSVTLGTVKDGMHMDVTAKFKLWACMDEVEMKSSVDEVHFDVIEEDGRPVISDIHRVGDEGRDSLREEMATIIKGK